MRLRWVGVIVVGGVLLLSAMCVGAIVAVGITQADTGSGDHVAVIPVHGQITTRSQDGLFATTGASAEEIIEQLERIRNGSGAKAVMLDIDSPGGGVVAAEQIHEEILRVQEEGIPVIAYFGDTAASAGYFIAAPADSIVSNPATVTGSIGVIAQVPNMEELFEKIGIDMQIIKSGEFKDMMQPARPLTEEEREILQQYIDESYDVFVDVVAEGREMNESEVRELADGRIYTGRQASENGLVDELGDYRDAVRVSGELAGLGSDPDVRTYARSTGFWDAYVGVTMENVDLPLPFDTGIDPRDLHLDINYGMK